MTQEEKPAQGYTFLEEQPDLFEVEGDTEPEGAASPAVPTYTARTLSRAYTVLLDNAVVSLQGDVDTFRLVRTHIAALEEWHEQHTGWRIQRGASFFRLERHLHTITPVFLDEKLKKARDFVCLVWLLWFAEKRYLSGGGRNQQFLLSQLAEELQKQSQGTEGVALDFRNQQDRYSMWRVLEYLTGLGGLRILEGEVKKWLEEREPSDHEALYEFTPIAHSLVEALNDRRVAAISTLLTDNQQRLVPDALPVLAQTIPPLFRAWRSLLLGPALFRYDDSEAFLALAAQSEQISNELAETPGWLLELNSDYACIVRGGSLSVGAGPGLTFNSAYDQMILLLCSAFRQQVEREIWVPDGYGCLRVTLWDINPLFGDLRQRFGSYWGATVQDIEARELLAEVYQRMRRLGLLRGPDQEGNMLIMPTAARYAVSYTTQEQQEEPVRTRSRSRKKTPAAPQLSFDMADLNRTAASNGAQEAP